MSDEQDHQGSADRGGPSDDADLADDANGMAFIVIDDGPTRWRFDADFLRSSWRCLWGDGCQGIHDRPRPELGDGCCSVGAHLDEDDARNLSAAAALLSPERFEYGYLVREDPGAIFSDASRTNTGVVDGACIFLNRPGFPGGSGCALHLEAESWDESPIDWKPSVCWQLPLRVDWVPDSSGDGETATVRRWTRGDWGPEGATMAWCCTEVPEAHSGSDPVHRSMADEIERIVGREVAVQLQNRLDR